MVATRAMIRSLHPEMIAANARQQWQDEVCKGSTLVLSPRPVALEPAFERIAQPSDLMALSAGPHAVAMDPLNMAPRMRFKIWVSPTMEPRWRDPEAFLRMLQQVSEPVSFEFAGNRAQIYAAISCSTIDRHILHGAFQGAFREAELGPDREPWPVPGGNLSSVVLADFAPLPPYSHRFTQPAGLPCPPLQPLQYALAKIDAPTIGLYQVVFQPVRHNWHGNIQILTDLEHKMKQLMNSPVPPHTGQQIPSADLRSMAADVNEKAHNDNPFFAGAMRMAVFNGPSGNRDALAAMMAAASLIQHGGRPWQWADEQHYHERGFTDEVLISMLQHRRVYRPGFLANANELAGMVHLPTIHPHEHRHRSMKGLEMLTGDNKLNSGFLLGTCQTQHGERPIYIPHDVRPYHMQLIGINGTGKTVVMHNLSLDDIDRGEGVAILDPHGDLVKQILSRIPAEHADRVIYLAWDDPRWLPRWNPLLTPTDTDHMRIADEFVGALKSVVRDWGDRLEHLLRFTLLGILSLDNPCLSDVVQTLRHKSKEQAEMRQAVLQRPLYPRVRQFWEHDLLKYTAAELSSPQNKLSKLVAQGPLSEMFCSTESSFDLRQCMDEGKILLFNLDGFASETQSIAGSLFLAMLYTAALSRSDTESDHRKRFNIYVDEAPRFLSSALEQIISETRKYNVPLTLAHQYFRQFPPDRAEAMTTTGSRIVFRVNEHDAARLCQGFRGRVEANDLMSLERYHAIADIDGHIARIKTCPPRDAINPSNAEKIIALSRQRYYRCADAGTTNAIYDGSDDAFSFDEL